LGYFSDLRIPEGRKGKWRIAHSIEKQGTKLTVVSMRDALFQGKKSSSIPLDRDYLVHALLEDEQRWMSDCPQEIESQREQLKRFKGTVLVGGLGLGYAALTLDQNPNVKEVVVVERQQAVIDLVWSYLPLTKAVPIKADLFQYLKDIQGKRRFDYAYYDVWGPTGERVLITHVRPLRALSEGIVKQKNIECWEEATMLGQIHAHLRTLIETWDMPPPFGGIKEMPEGQFQKTARGSGTHWAFLNWMRQTKPSREEALRFMNHYVDTYSNLNKWGEVWDAWDAQETRR